MSAERGCLFLWRGRAMLVGPGIDSKFHCHYAAQLTLALDRPFRVRLSADSPWTATSAAIFAPNQTHQLDGAGAMLAHLFVDLSKRLPSNISSLAPAYPDLPSFIALRAGIDAARRGRLTIDDAAQLAQTWQQCALPATPTPSGVDARVLQTLDWISAYPGNRLSGALLASKVHLSESRFTHLFRQKTGMSLSRYLLWSRLLHAVEAVALGENMTNAAHAAGFADLAHMSRTFRSTFGVVPSELQKMTIAFKRNGV